VWKHWVIALALLPTLSFAQLLPVSNVVLRGGIAPGYTELQTNGMIRWNQTNLIHEGWNGSTWAPIAGSGSGFPLTNDALAGGFSISDINILSATNAVLAPNITSISNQAASALASSVWASADSTTNYARRIDYVDFTNAYFVADSTTNYARRTGDTFTGPVTGTLFSATDMQTDVLDVFSTFRYRGTNALTKAYLMHDGTNIAFQYAPREIWTPARFAQAIVSNEFVYPGQQLLWPNVINFQQRDDMFQLKQTISPLVYTNADYPTPANSAFWDLVLRQGRDGSTGAKGDDGAANIFYLGEWSGTNANFTFSTSSVTWVGYQGQVYRLLQNSSILTPPDVSPSNWAVQVSRGAAGIVTTVSNLVDRGTWNSFTAYTNLDLVIYAGNTFYVDPTNAPPGTNTLPVLNSDGIGQSSSFWTIRTQRGARGIQGLKGIDGVDGAVTTNIFNEFISIIIDTNNYYFTNSPSTTNRLPVFLSTVNDTNQYAWVSYAPIGTNNLTVSNGLLYLNNQLAGGNARMTSAWSIIYSDANTNSIALRLGASNTVLRSNGSNAPPVWAVLDDLSFKLAPITSSYTAVSYNFVLADTTASDIFVTLPAANVNSGKVVAARKMSPSNTLYVRAPSGNQVQGVGTVGVVRAGSVIEVISNGGTNWWLK
jgi:hypothetical protein